MWKMLNIPREYAVNQRYWSKGERETIMHAVAITDELA
jgi:hypothetical protein